MKFRTEIEVERSHHAISHANRLLLVGSCFSENIGLKLQEGGFVTGINPMGIVYNPASAKVTLERLISNNPYGEEELYQHHGLWHTFDHHGKYSHSDKSRCVNQINDALSKGNKLLKNAGYLMVTFGTAWVYRHQQLNRIVSNCHKYPATVFERERLSVDAIVSEWSELIKQLRTFNPSLNIIFTVSPVRHWKDGAHGNQLSKSILHLAVDALCQKFNFCNYFPAYELLLDDLRDYRFFADDMLHPNKQAVDYIWEKFSETYFDDQTKRLIKQVQKIKQAAAHRPLKPDTDEYRKFAQKQLAKIEELKQQCSQLQFDQEVDYFSKVIE